MGDARTFDFLNFPSTQVRQAVYKIIIIENKYLNSIDLKLTNQALIAKN